MTPNLKAKAEEMDREIARLSETLADEKAETKGVVDGLLIRLRHNRLLNSASRAASGLPSDTPLLLLPYQRK